MTALAYVELLDASCYHALAFHKRLCLVYSVTRVGLILGPKVLSELSRWIKDASSPYIEEVNPAEIFHVVNALLPQARTLALTTHLRRLQSHPSPLCKRFIHTRYACRGITFPSTHDPVT